MTLHTALGSIVILLADLQTALVDELPPGDARLKLFARCAAAEAELRAAVADAALASNEASERIVERASEAEDTARVLAEAREELDIARRELDAARRTIDHLAPPAPGGIRSHCPGIPDRTLP